MRDAHLRGLLERYYRSYLAVACELGLGFTLNTPTWRANAHWGGKLGYSAKALAAVNRDAVGLLEQIRAEEETASTPIVLAGVIGPRGDAYHPAGAMSAAEAERYHAQQIATFRDTAADMVGAFTLTYAEEAIGIARAAASQAMPVSISFTVETDGRLPSGQELGPAIEQADAATDGAPAFFLINCAHPSHFAAVLECGGPWVRRLGGLRANASRKSHAELDRASALDAGDPDELGAQYALLKPHTSRVRVLGGCCGTDPRHVERICASWMS